MKTPPHSIEAEQTVIGTMYLWPETVATVSTILEDDDWYSGIYKILFVSFKRLSTADCGLDIVTLTNHLEKIGEIKRVGGVEQLTKLGDYSATRQTVKHHAEIIRLKSAQRAVMKVAQKVLNDGYNPESPETYPADSLKAINDVVANSTKVEVESISKGTTELIARIYSNESAAKVIKTGYKSFDYNLGGLPTGLVTILSGRPKMGKSMTSLNFGISMAKSGTRILDFSLEDKTENQRFRTLSCISGVGLTPLKYGQVDHVAATKLNAALTVINGLPMDFVDKPSTAQQICQFATAYRYKYPNEQIVVIVDHLGYIRGDSDPFKRITEAMRDLCDLAKNLDIVVLALSQLNRQLESRPDKRPRESDLKSTGHIEEDARMVLAVYRDVVYNENAPDDLLELLVLKNTDGKSGFGIEFGCNLPTVSIYDLNGGY